MSSVQSPSSLLSALVSKRGVYILALGGLVGTSIFNSFIAGPTMYRNLPRQQFGNVQKALFPIYFKLQSAGALALLYLWTKGGVTAKNAGPKFNLWLLGTMVATGVINLVAVGPWTTKIMLKRHRLERLEGKTYDAADKSPEMKKLNSSFMWAHSVSSLLNLGYMVAGVLHTAWVGEYGL